VEEAIELARELYRSFMEIAPTFEGEVGEKYGDVIGVTIRRYLEYHNIYLTDEQFAQLMERLSQEENSK